MSESELLGEGLPGVEHISPFALPAGGCSVFDAGLREVWHQGSVVLCVAITSQSLLITV